MTRSPMSRRWRARIAALAGAGLFGTFWLVQGLLTARSTDTSFVESVAAEHRAAAAEIPYEAFVRDRANRVSGTVVARGRGALAGASVSVYDASDVAAAIAPAAPGRWPDVEPEATTTTDERGRYEIADLRYGRKIVEVDAPGFESASVPDVVHVDGGGSEVDIALVPFAPTTLRLVDAAGPVAGEPVTFLPPVWSAEPTDSRTDADGRVRVPESVLRSEGLLELLVGDPATLVRTASSRVEPLAAELDVEVPPVADFALRILGPESDGGGGDGEGAVDVSLFPAGAQRFGHRRMRVALRDGVASIPGVRAGAYGVLVRRGGLSGWSWLEHDGSPRSLELHLTRSLAITLRDEGGAGIAGTARWEPEPAAPRSLFPRTPRAWADAVAALVTTVATGPDGGAEIGPIVGGAGRIEAEAPGYAPSRASFDASAERIDLALRPGTKVYISGARPYVPVVVEAGGVTSTGTCDAFAEATVSVPEGPLVARTGLPRGVESRPRGHWILPREDATLDFNLLDEVAPNTAIVYGFVTDPEGAEPREATLHLRRTDGEGAWFVRTDEHGFYCFASLEAGAYELSLFPGEASAAVGYALPLELETHADAVTLVRLDRVSWPGSPEGPPASRALRLPGGAGEVLELPGRDG